MTDNLSCRIMNTRITATTVDQAVDFLRLSLIESPENVIHKYVLNLSLNDVMDAGEDEEYAGLINRAVLAFPASHQLSMQMKSDGYPMSSKINIRVFMDKFLQAASSPEYKHFFICENENQTESLKKALEDKCRNLNIVGIVAYEDNEDISARIAQSGANIVWTCLNGKAAAVFSSEICNTVDAVIINAGYGINDWIKGKSSEVTGRLTGKYFRMNMKYIFKTGRKSVIRLLSWIPAMITLIVIFVLSSQRGVASVQNSRIIATRIVEIPIVEMNVDISGGVKALESFNSVVRTVAHVTEYFCLSLFTGFAVTVNGIKDKIRFIITCFLCMTVAVLDEFLQIFIPDRYGDISDVICDWLGIIFIAGIIYILGKKRHKKEISGHIHSSDTISRRKFLNIRIDDISFEEALDRIIIMAKGEGREDYKDSKYVVTPNSDHVIKMEKDEMFRKILEDADLILTDGTPLMWIADSIGYPIREKIPGADMFPRVCERAAKEGVTVFLFGAAEGIADIAAKNLTERYPGLKIVGTYSPSYGFEKKPEEVDKAIEAVNAVKPDILVVGLGAPKQEKFIYKYKDRMLFHIALPFGAAIDFEAGNVPRAPRWMREMGLEWFFRFLQEPGRMFKRYFVDDMKIFYLAWKYRNEIIRIGEDSEKE